MGHKIVTNNTSMSRKKKSGVAITKVHTGRSNTKLMQTPIISERYMARLVSRNKHQKHTCYNNIGIRQIWDEYMPNCRFPAFNGADYTSAL